MSVNRQLLWSSPVFTPPLHDCHVAVQKVAMGGPDAADSDEPVKVVAIVGAGLAGLAAANALRHSRNCRPLLLEASDSIGGRVRQISAGDGGVHEMGAEFFHGSSAPSPSPWASHARRVAEAPANCPVTMAIAAS